MPEYLRLGSDKGGIVEDRQEPMARLSSEIPPLELQHVPPEVLEVDSTLQMACIYHSCLSSNCGVSL